MSKILKSLQIVTQSFIGTPTTGSGVVFASGSRLYFENPTEAPQVLGGPGYIKVLEYTGSNPGGGTLTYTWTKPSNIKHIQVICVGAGGGGGGGRSQNSGRVTGGTGGGGGAIAWGFFDRKDLIQPSYSISVGSGGAGGAASAAGVTANAGVSGQYTTFGETLVSASGGSGGVGGVSNAIRAGGAGGLNTACRPGPVFAITGGTGGGVTSNGATSPLTSNFFATSLTPISTAGGGAGGGYDSLVGPTAYSGSSGASGFQWNTLQTNGGSPGKPATSGSDDLVTAAVLLQFTSSVFSTVYGLGGGGHGGDVNTTQLTGYAGSNAGLYGAGGGGGGGTSAVAGSPTSGAGGSGSSGLCIVVEYY
jgi:hypothetical protein